MGKVWVLAGAMGSGKSTVARLFEDEGARILDADALAHDLLREETWIARSLADVLGEAVLDEEGQADRKKIGELVFSDPEARRRLESLLHPLVLEKLTRISREFREKEEGLLLLEVVLWLTLDPAPFPVDEVLVIVAPEEEMIKRVMQRDGLRESETRLRLKAQGHWWDWAKKSDRTLDTDCDRESLRDQVRLIYRGISSNQGKGIDDAQS